MTLTIYHNPRCSKSRQTLALLEGRGLKPNVVLYLETPPSETELREVLKKLGKRPIEVMRIKENGGMITLLTRTVEIGPS